MSTHIIAVAGPSCAGKTELAKRLARSLSATILSMDAYYRDLAFLPLESRSKFNFDLPDSLDHTLLREHLTALAAGLPIQRPVYDFTIHTRSSVWETVTPGPFLILEGLFALYWDDLRPLLTTKVYVDAPDEVCLARRQVRDVLERGRTAESVHKQYIEIVRPMAELYIHPTRRFADVVVSGQVPLEQSTVEVMARITAAPPAATPASGANPT
ncbi:MAG: uridine kinase [Acidobacteriia bacterium]|nr:uridine kinase [Terriglobia bacterium]